MINTQLRAAPRFLLFALALLLLGIAAPPVSAQNPTAWWKFDEGSGTTASDSSGSNVGTLQAGATWATGIVGPSCVSLPGSNTGFIDVPAPVIDTTQSYTIMGWVNLNTISGYQTFVSIDGTQVSGFFLQLRGDTGKFALSALAADAPGAPTYATASAAPVTGQWYHVAGVYDATAQTLSLYVNGALQQTVSYTAAWKAGGHTEIGRGKYSGGPVDFVNGKIDDVRFYNSALPAASISAIAAAPFQTPNPVAWWKFDEGAGTTAADSAGANPGTLQSGAAWATGLVGPSCISLPGSNTGFVDIPAPVVDTTQSYTVMGWVNLNQTGGYQTIVSIDGSNVSGFYLQQRGNTGEFGFVALAADSTSAATTFASASAPPVTGEWYHVAGVYDATAKTLSLYVNGALQQTVSYTAAWKATGHTEVGRGKYNAGPVDFVNGKIDDVRVYNAALPAATINAIAQANLPPPPPPTLQINAATPLATVSPTFFGMMTEEINHAFDGGVYAELIQNRIFQDSASSPVHWSAVQDNGAAGSIALDTTQPISGTALTTCLKVTAAFAGRNRRVGAANDGYWGIPVTPNTTYTASFYAQAAAGFTGPVTVDIESSDGTVVYATAQVPQITTSWQQYSATLTTGNVAPAENTRFVVSVNQPGTLWLNLVSLFPPTFNNRPNGNRIDLMQKMAGLTPSFLRLPGGNYLEGNTIDQRFEWKNTIGPLSGRAGHESPWGYRSSDGMGLLEFLEWCEDLHMQPVLAVYAGYSLQGAYVAPGAALTPYVQDALDEIQYLTGDTSTTWGAQRALDGHPAAFPLTYVEVGNEDFFDKSNSYDGRFSQFYDAIKAAYPSLQLIATTGVSSRTPDVYDDHYYRSPSAFESDVHHYDNYSRAGTKIFVGEWASQEGSPTPDLNAALGDAAWLTGLEHDSDVVVLESYAPLLVNVNSGASQWGTNLIGYDALTSYGSPSYYVQAMFGANHGDKILGGASGGLAQIYYSATSNSKTGTLYLKVVNAAGLKQLVHVTLNGAANVAPGGTAITLSSGSPSDTNTLTNPVNVVPVTTAVTGLGPKFDYTFAPYSVTVLKIPMTQAQVLTSLVISPAVADVLLGTTRQFTAVAYDQNGAPLSPQPAFTWKASGGVISAAGLFRCNAIGGPYTITAAAGTVKGTATVYVPSAPQSLTATPGNVQVTLAWNKPAGTVTSYTVTYGTAPGAENTTVTGLTSTTTTVTGLTNGQAYYFVVSTTNPAGTSLNSGEVSATPSASAAPVTTALTPTADSYVWSGSYAGQNKGVVAFLTVANTGSPAASGDRCAYLKFDLTGMTQAPTSAKLALMVDGSSHPTTGAATVQIFSITDTSWTELGVTWNNAPGLNTSSFTSTGTLLSSQSVSLKSGTPLTYDLTSFVSSHLGQVVTLQLFNPNADSAISAFISREGTTGKPTLTLTF